jgi:hypothetical protein
MKRYLFTDESGKVVHLIEGDHSQEVIDQFKRDYWTLFKAANVYEVSLESPVWINWTWNGSEFTAPPEILADQEVSTSTVEPTE